MGAKFQRAESHAVWVRLRPHRRSELWYTLPARHKGAVSAPEEHQPPITRWVSTSVHPPHESRDHAPRVVQPGSCPDVAARRGGQAMANEDKAKAESPRVKQRVFCALAHHREPPMNEPRPPRLPDCPEGVNPFDWIVRTAPAIREARRISAERYRMERDHDQIDWRPARLQAKPEETPREEGGSAEIKAG